MNLFWNDINKNKYLLGVLKKEGEYFYFKLNYDGLKNAMQHGCFGVGNIDISSELHKSKELFSFFKNRIPQKDNVNIKEILEQYSIQEYDEIELLKKTQGRLLTDRYYLEE